MKPSPLKTHAEVLAEIFRFVDDIANYAANPADWPLTDEERIAFVRRAIFQARKLQASEPYAALTMACLINSTAKKGQ